MTIQVICSWCGRVLGSKNIGDDACPDLEKPISHGICEKCMKRELSRIPTHPDKPEP